MTTLEDVSESYDRGWGAALRLDLVTGEETQLHRYRSASPLGFADAMAISPDGDHLAMIYPLSSENRRPTQLMPLPAAGGELREVYRTMEGEHLVSKSRLLDWTPHGDLIFATRRPEDDTCSKIRRSLD